MSTYTTGTKQKLTNVHSKESCTGDHCVIHNPSDHCMKDFLTHWRSDRHLMERICSHGIGHPDPDHLMYVFKTHGKEAAGNESVHGCDGCCSPC